MTGQGKTVLVLGASGRVGRLLRAVWSDRPPQGLRILYQYREDPPPGGDCIRFAPGDPTGPLGHVDAILSLWGVTSGDDQALAANTDLALEAMRIARDTGADRVLHASSIAVYAPSDQPLAEDAPVDPPNAYGAAKAAMEKAVASASAPRSCCMRIGSVAGAESLAASVDVYLAETKTPVLHRFGSGHGPARSYIAPYDLAKAIVALVHCPRADLPAVLNIGAARPVTMDALLTAANIPFDWRPAPDGARETAVLNTGRLHRITPLPQDDGDPDRIARDWLKWRGHA